MKRVHTLEFEDLSWFPSWLRTSMTNLLVVLVRLLGAGRILAARIAQVAKDQKIDTIVDLGSGAGGAMPEVLGLLRESPQTAGLKLIMTDLYPNLDAIDRFNVEGQGHLRYHRQSVDATDLASAPAGLKTMINCFHHMRPAQARRILASAQKHRQPLLIYEMAEHKQPFLLWMLLLPLSLPITAVMALVFTPFVRPLTFRQLFFTYVVPLVPIFYAWDGQASLPRMYSLQDLDELLEGIPSDGYRWEKGPARTETGRARGIYLLGMPA